MIKKTATALVIPALIGGALWLGTGTAHADRVRPIAAVEDTEPGLLNGANVHAPITVPITVGNAPSLLLGY